eukprot:1161322-Pelagomonas_calceolata.AAC.8
MGGLAWDCTHKNSMGAALMPAVEPHGNIQSGIAWEASIPVRDDAFAEGFDTRGKAGMVLTIV